MDSTKINNRMQIGTALALIVGLALVVWELQQTRDAVKSQLTSDGFQLMGQFYTSAFGERPEEVLAKACDAPTELTTADLIVLDHIYTQIVHRSLRIIRVRQRGGFYEQEFLGSEKLQRDSTGGWGMLFSTAPGRAFWRTLKGDPELKAYGDRIFAKWDRESCTQHNKLWRAVIAEEAEKDG